MWQIAKMRRSLMRVAALVLVLVALGLIGRALGLTKMDPEEIRALVESAGPWGAAGYAAFFAVGNTMQIPASALFVGGVVLFGPVMGWGVGYVGALGALTLSFWLARLVGGQPLTNPMGGRAGVWLTRGLELVRRRPVLGVALLRCIFMLSPLVTYPLALSDMRFRDFMLGSALGLALPFAGLTAVVSGLLKAPFAAGW